MTTKRPVHCSFCAAPDGEVRLLFQGLGAVAPHICEGCVSLFADIVTLDGISPALAERAVRMRNQAEGRR
jgi:hypothetical protein